MKKVLILLAIFAVTGIASANLLTNGDFETPQADGWDGTGWTSWGWGNGWSEHVIKPAVPNGGNGTYLVNVGNGWYNGGGGAFQVVAATEGQAYRLTVDSGADAWWQPTGEMAMIWLDASNVELGKTARFTVDPAVYGYQNDIAHPMANYILTGMAPAGTTQVKVEFASRMPDGIGGSVTFDNAVLEVVPEPATMIMLGLGALVLRRKK